MLFSVAVPGSPLTMETAPAPVVVLLSGGM